MSKNHLYSWLLIYKTIKLPGIYFLLKHYNLACRISFYLGLNTEYICRCFLAHVVNARWKLYRRNFWPNINAQSYYKAYVIALLNFLSSIYTKNQQKALVLQYYNGSVVFCTVNINLLNLFQIEISCKQSPSLVH